MTQTLTFTVINAYQQLVYGTQEYSSTEFVPLEDLLHAQHQIQLGRLRGLAVACWITDHYQLCSNLSMGICEGCFIFTSLHYHLAYHVHKSGHKTPIINQIQLWVDYKKKVCMFKRCSYNSFLSLSPSRVDISVM